MLVEECDYLLHATFRVCKCFNMCSSRDTDDVLI